MENNNAEKNNESIGSLLIKLIFGAISIALVIYMIVEVNKIFNPPNPNKFQQNETDDYNYYYTLDDTILLGDLEMTISDIGLKWWGSTLLLDEYSPTPGCGFVTVDVTLFNPTNDSVDIPCLYCRYTDSLYCDYKVELVIDDEITYSSGRAYGNKKFINYYSTFIAKQGHSGIYAFEVPENVYEQGKKFELKIRYHKKNLTILLRNDK